MRKDEGQGPGAASGREDRPHERIVPGTESAAEGYEDESEGGTREGDPTAGVERDEGERGTER
ncbi:hypothetical protein [Actinomadura algeriensis]|uniref:Uncharacterized protein n=1 Tax=Actinomadura algeriensis TaxID=1679523 RepID=A0ABR9JXW8_9ACTN|nr:hypothetical protein [Actinomadura algeriensis]MBE1535415.1 hypothetical protein [Actinomadura algeriensis]